MVTCVFNVLDSTNKEAKRIIQTNRVLPKRFTLLSHLQNNGIGKLNTKWFSVLGNLTYSIVFVRESFVNNVKDISLISIAACVAVRETLSEIFLKLGIKSTVFAKWPNDILIEKKKVCGILVEVEKHNNIDYVIVGIGVNIVSSPQNIKYETTYINNFVNNINNIELSYLIEDRFISLLSLINSNKEILISKFKKHLYGINNTITINSINSIITGVFKDIDSSGYIILKDSNGEEKIIFSGEVLIVK